MRRFGLISFPAVISIIILVLSAPGLSHAKDLKTEYDELNKKIEAQKQKIEGTKKAETSVLGELDEANRELDGTRKELGQYRQRLAETVRRVKTVREEISVVTVKLRERNEWMKRKLIAMQKYGRYVDLAVLVSSSEDISQLIRRWRYLEILAAYEQEVMVGYRKDIETLNEKAAELEKLQEKLRDSESRVRLAEKALSVKREKKETILASVRKEKASYQKMLDELKLASEKILDMIRGSEGEKYADRGFQKNRGRLQWPVNGQIALPYGSQKDPQFNVPVFRNGLYIETENGVVAKAVYGGKVVFADWFKGYGQLVIINHGGGYHTLYANLSEIFLKTGDIIEGRADIGKVGESSMLNRPSLYFEVRYKGKPLNPEQWLK